MMSADKAAQRARNREVMERWACEAEGNYNPKTLAYLVTDTSVGAVADRFLAAWPWAGMTRMQAASAVLDAVTKAHRLLKENLLAGHQEQQ